jgi:F-type H+-transporting ATPase subunit epsilon
VANILFELISPERVLFSDEVRAVLLPATEGDMTVMPGHQSPGAGEGCSLILTNDN